MRARCSGPNDSGSSSASVVVRRTRSRSARWIGASSARELAQPLAAAAARRAQLAAGRGDDDLGDPPAAAGHERADRRRLRALALRVGGVLDVRAGVAAAVVGAHARRRRGSRSTARRRAPAASRASASSSGSGSAPRGDQRVGVGALAQRVVADRRAARAAARPARARARGRSPARRPPRARGTLPSPATLVEVDPDGLPQQQPAALVDDRARRRWRRRAPRAAPRGRRPARAGSATRARPRRRAARRRSASRRPAPPRAASAGPARDGEVGVALAQQPAVLRARGERALERRGRDPRRAP